MNSFNSIGSLVLYTANKTPNYAVTVTETNPVFVLNGRAQPMISFKAGKTYIFTQDQTTYFSYPIVFGTLPDSATHVSESWVTTTTESDTVTITLVLPSTFTGGLFYYCSSLPYMGNRPATITASATTILGSNVIFTVINSTGAPVSYTAAQTGGTNAELTAGTGLSALSGIVPAGSSAPYTYTYTSLSTSTMTSVSFTIGGTTVTSNLVIAPIVSLNGTATYQGKTCYDFSAASSEAAVTVLTSVKLTTEYTLCFWIYVPSPSTFASGTFPITLHNGDSANYGVVGAIYSGYIGYNPKRNIETQFVLDGGPVLGNWNHYSIKSTYYTPTKIYHAEIFRNGNYVTANNSLSSSIFAGSNNTTLVFGRNWNGTSLGVTKPNVYIRNIQLYSSFISDTMINSVYNSTM